MSPIAVIGAGTSGIAASLAAANSETPIFLFDSNEKPGSKLSITGSGRGNLSNTHVSAEKYSSDNNQSLQKIFAQFGHHELAQWLSDLGIPTYTTSDGWCYPISNSAANVVHIFSAHLLEKNIHFFPGHKIVDIRPVSTGFRLRFEKQNQTMDFSQVIIACGGKAYPRLGSRGELFPTLERLGHTILPIYPALAPVVTEIRPIHALQGVRMDLEVTLFRANKVIAKNLGKAIFTEWGMNGPAVMDLSHLIASANKGDELSFSINFLHRFSSILTDIFSKFRHHSLPVQSLLESVTPAKVARWAMTSVDLSTDLTMEQINDSEIARLMNHLSSFRIKIKGTKGFEDCQVSSGGVKLSEVDPQTMQSYLYPGLFIAGEVLNVVGPCGGYNLQWAFSSGVIAGKAAGKNP